MHHATLRCAGCGGRRLPRWNTAGASIFCSTSGWNSALITGMCSPGTTPPLCPADTTYTSSPPATPGACLPGGFVRRFVARLAECAPPRAAGIPGELCGRDPEEDRPEPG